MGIKEEIKMIDYEEIRIPSKGGIKLIHYDRIRMRSLAGFFALNLCTLIAYVYVITDGNVDWFMLLLLIHLTGFPLMYHIFYYPQLWYVQMRTTVKEVEVIKEVEVLREIEVIKEVPVFREQQQPNILIKNVNVKDGVIMEE